MTGRNKKGQREECKKKEEETKRGVVKGERLVKQRRREEKRDYSGVTDEYEEIKRNKIEDNNWGHFFFNVWELGTKLMQLFQSFTLHML